MSLVELNLEHLPLQEKLVESVYSAFHPERDVVAAVLLGSLASGTGDRVSDADILVFTENNYHKAASPSFSRFESGKDIFYSFADFHDSNKNGYFKKYIFNDMSSAEIHCLDVSEDFGISHPFKILFDKLDIVEGRLTDAPPPRHEDFPAYYRGDDGLIWELFDCIKWLSRNDTELAKNHIKKLSAAMEAFV
ncbi:nucleotidyltransferase domain-containing protein [Enterovibrio calviensis]|uniref:nucleotidyltransferase domain-containing protein n=1 Tax=Enterovibrio calviensis TaxID=91359 RepID=UPI00047F0926|nr:nucleotidyltransferase domain-containing protein [Enterovibrio calviensis]